MAKSEPMRSDAWGQMDRETEGHGGVVVNE